MIPSLLFSLPRSPAQLSLFFPASWSLSICQGQQSAKNHIKKYSNVELVAIGIHTSIKDCQIEFSSDAISATDIHPVSGDNAKPTGWRGLEKSNTKTIMSPGCNGAKTV